VNTAVVPLVPQVPPASRSVADIPNDSEVTVTGPHPVAAGEAAIAPGLARVDHDVPASELVSMVPSLNSAARRLPLAANASGDAATPAFSGPPADHALPPFVVAASGVNVRSWLGRTATLSESAPPAAATSPPLMATPGGVTSFQVGEFAARENTCQNAGSAAIGTIAQVS